MAGLKVVALVSGGKDSMFSLLHCIANGHQIVALANLYPPTVDSNGSVDDIDSYMYQTIGHAVIPLFQGALGLPLYRQEILGSAVNRCKEYGPSEDNSISESDETESLIPLLQRVKAAHPVINAVSTGAILSDYQRTRVESVAVRLGLTPLAFLWQWPVLPPYTQESLLEDMAAVGQDARIIKVASGGLDDSFLWHNVAESKTFRRLRSVTKRFSTGESGAVLGEGGEYETLTINGPKPLWKAAVVFDRAQIRLVSGEAGSAFVKMENPWLVLKAAEEADAPSPRIPPLWDTTSHNILKKVLDALPVQEEFELPLSDPLPSDVILNDPIAEFATKHWDSEDVLLLANYTGDGSNPQQQTHAIFQHLDTSLKQRGHDSTDVAYVSVILRNIEDFQAVNEAYITHVSTPNPPARVTVACSDVLSEGSLLSVTLTSVRIKSVEERRSLHVQSRSYWAPANIGPYSQAISVQTSPDSELRGGRITYVAGQIPLVPATMQILQLESIGSNQSAEFANQCILALQHLVRIGEQMETRCWVACIAFVCAPTVEGAYRAAWVARLAWRLLHEFLSEKRDKPNEDETEDFDVWDFKNQVGRYRLNASRAQRGSIPQLYEHNRAPPLWIFRAEALPRASAIEWVGYGGYDNAEGHVTVPHLHHLLRTFQRRLL